MMSTAHSPVRLPHLFQGYEEFFLAAADGDGWVSLSGRLNADVPPRHRTRELVYGAFIRDRLFFYRVHGSKDWVLLIDADVEVAAGAGVVVAFNLCKLLQLPGVAPRQELQQMATFCRVLKDVCGRQPSRRLYLNVYAPATRHVRKGERAYQLQLLANRMDGSGRLEPCSDPKWIAPVIDALDELPAVRYFFDRYTQESLHRRRRHVHLDLDELYPFGDSPSKAYFRKHRQTEESAR